MLCMGRNLQNEFKTTWREISVEATFQHTMSQKARPPLEDLFRCLTYYTGITQCAAATQCGYSYWHRRTFDLLFQEFT